MLLNFRTATPVSYWMDQTLDELERWIKTIMEIEEKRKGG